MNQDVEKQIRALKLYVAALTLVVAGLIGFIFWQPDNTNFKEINAERINIVESDSRLRMVISNQQRQHPGVVDGKTLPQRERSAGMIFFNDDGDECGGLVFEGNKKGGGMVYSVDQYKNDQIMQLQYAEDAGEPQRVRGYGLKLWDRRDDFTTGDLLRLDDSLKRLNDTAIYRAAIKRLQSDNKMGAERLFVGKTKSKSVGLFIRDSKGRPRIEIGLDENNNVLLHVRDTAGRIQPFKL